MSESSEGIAGKMLVGVVVTVFGAGIVYYLGWNDVRSKSRDPIQQPITISSPNTLTNVTPVSGLRFDAIKREMVFTEVAPDNGTWVVGVQAGNGWAGIRYGNVPGTRMPMPTDAGPRVLVYAVKAGAAITIAADVEYEKLPAWAGRMP